MLAPELRPGGRARVAGLKARPELNGLLGDLVGFEEAEGRWRVRLDDGQGKMLRACNLEAVAFHGTEDILQPGMRVTVHGLTSRPELNGAVGTLADFDDAEGRWQVRLDDSTGKLLKAGNLRPLAGAALVQGCRARVRGLQARPDLNGQVGTLSAWDEEEQRWELQLDSGGPGRMLRAENLEWAAAGPASSAAAGAGASLDPREAEPAATEAVPLGPATGTADAAAKLGRPPLPQALEVEPGARVRVCGVLSQPELNGQRGTAVEWDAGEARWKVLMDNGAKKMLKPLNLEAIDEHATSTAERFATGDCTEPVITGTAPSSSSCAPPRPDAPAEGIALGSCIRVRGLRSRPSMNGRRGTVVGWDGAEGRWRVVMEDGARKILRPANVEPCDHAGAEFSALEDEEDEDASVPDSGLIMPQSRVSVCGIKNQPELNGQLGTAVEWSTERMRWKVLMDDGTGKLFRPANLRVSREDLGGGVFHSPTRQPAAESSEPICTEAQDDFVGGTLSAQADGAHIGPGSEVLVVGLRARPELNGQRGTVVEWDSAELRWKVAMNDGSGKMFREANLTTCGSPEACNLEAIGTLGVHASPSTSSDSRAMVPGTRVVVSGIKVQQHLNGSQGVLVEWDEVEARWKVAMDDGSGKMLRPYNLIACDSEQPVFQPGSGNPQGVDAEAIVEEEIPSASGAALEIAPGARVVISGIRAQPHLNGKHGTVVDWDGAEGRWKVVMDDGSGKMLKPTNLLACSFQPPAAWLDVENPQAVEHEVLPAECPVAPPAIGPGARVVVLGIKAQPHLNGQRGSVVDWDDAEGRWKVLMDDGSGKMLRPANLSPSGLQPPARTPDTENPQAVEHDKLCSASQTSQDLHAILPGARVMISGVRAQPHLNGQCGTVVEWDSTDGRWKVAMDDGSGKMLRPANVSACGRSADVLPPAPQRENPQALEQDDIDLQPEALADSGPDAVKAFGTTVSGNGHTIEGSRIEVDPVIAPGSRVVVFGIMAQPHLNGQFGTAVEFDEFEGRWKVAMDDGSGKMLRPGNLAASDQADGDPAAFHPEPAAAPASSGPGAEACAAIAPGSRVFVSGIRAQPHLNGQLGTAVEFDAAEGRWKVVMDDGSKKMFRPVNLAADADPAQAIGQSSNSGKNGFHTATTVASEGAASAPSPSTSDPPAAAFSTAASIARDPPPQALLSGDDAVDIIYAGSRVVVSGVRTQPHLNGQLGTTVEFDSAEERWKVVMDDGSRKMFMPGNLTTCEQMPEAPVGVEAEPRQAPGSCTQEGGLAMETGVAPALNTIRPGSRVVVSGIKTQVHLNGQLGTAVEFDEDEDRWGVVMDDGSRKMLRPANLAFCEHVSTAPAAPESEALPESGAAPVVGGGGLDEDLSAGAEGPGADGLIATGSRVVVSGLRAQPHLNGQLGTAVEFDEAEGRWKVAMDDGSGKMLRPNNVALLQHTPPAPVASQPEPAPAIGSSDATTLGAKVDDTDARHVIIPGSRVVVSGIRAQPHLNGQFGTAVELDEMGNRWKVLMDDGCGKMFKPANLAACDSTKTVPAAAGSDLTSVVPEPEIAYASQSSNSGIEHTLDADCPGSTQAITVGSSVLVSGIKAQPHLNGQFGTAVEFDNAEGRWKVAMDDGSGKLLRPANLTVCDEVLSACDVANSAQSCPSGAPGVEYSVGAIRAEEVGPEITSGSRVIVSDTKDQSHLNGQLGTATEVDEAESRWKVAMDDRSGSMARPANHSLSQRAPVVPIPIHSGVARAEEAGQGITPGSIVTLSGLKTQPHMNGMSGTVVEFDEAEGRWKVAMDDGSGKLLRSANLVVTDRAPASPPAAAPGSLSICREDSSSELDADAPLAIVPGSRVVVSGIKARPHLNGQFGVAVEFDVGEQRWKVDMDDGSGKLLRAANLTASDPAPASPAAAGSGLAPASSPGAPWCLYEPASAEPFEAIVPGSRVVVSGVSAQPHLNGQLGTVVEFDAGEGRWKVMMDDGSRKMFRPAHLAACEQGLAAPAAPSVEPGHFGNQGDGGLSTGSRVRVTGLRSEAHLNGQLGTAIAWAGAEERWKVVLDDGSGKLLRPANLEVVVSVRPPQAAAGTGESEDTGGIAMGSRVVATGVRNQPHLDGQAGTAIEWDEVEERWKVAMDGGGHKMLAPENLLPEPDGSAQVTMDDGAGKTLRRVNLEAAGSKQPAPSPRGLERGARVRASGIVSQPGLNGQLGTLVEWDEAESRWKVLMDDGSRKMLRPVNLEAELATGREADEMPSGAATVVPGCRVRISGIQTQPEYNGQLGIAVELDEGSQRWKVLMDDGSRKLFRHSNVEPCGREAPEADAGAGAPGAAAGGGPRLTPTASGPAAAGPPPSGQRGVAVGAGNGPGELPVPRVPLGAAVAAQTAMGVAETLGAAGEAQIEPGARVSVVGVRSLPELNGQIGTVVEWDEPHLRWKVVMDDGIGKMLRPANIAALAAPPPPARGQAPQAEAERIAPGSRVEIVGLKARVDLNGLQGVADLWSEEESRWSIRLDDGSRMMFREVNIKAAPGSTPATRPVALGELVDTPELAGPSELPEAVGTALQVGSRVRVHGLRARLELNGQMGILCEWDVADERWKVRMDDGTGKMLRSANLELAV